jgi:cysteine desulfurase
MQCATSGRYPSMVYLDANATEPLRPEARAAVLAVLECVGNPSSVHGPGRAARRILEDAREAIAGRFEAVPADVVFTSGGTEANALAVHALGAGRRIIIGATEHPAVSAAAPGAELLAVDREGVADLKALEAALAGGAPTLVCLMLANNETGTIQPIAEAAAVCRRYGALLHVDAVQAARRIELSLRRLGAHSLALSAHKLGGPTGAGALLLASEVSSVRPLIAGGGQERGRRAGTPALAAIAGLAAAARSSDPGSVPQLARWRDVMEAAAVEAGAVVCGGAAPRLGNTTCLALPGVRADAQVIALDLAGIAVSAGAACSSGKVAASHVLAAMGLGRLAGEAIRVSLPWNAAAGDVEAFAGAYRKMAASLRGALAPRAA